VSAIRACRTPVSTDRHTSLTNIIKADKGSRTSERVRSTVLNLQLLDVVVKLLRSEATEERVKLCFVLGGSTMITLTDRPSR
jgi:hypothetical protein